MKEPKRVKKAIKTLDNLVSYLRYYMGDTLFYKSFVKDDINDLKNLIHKLSIDQHIQNIKLAKKIKDAQNDENS